MSIKSKFRIYSINKYSDWTANRIKNDYEEYDVDDLVKILKNNNKGYHQRINSKNNYQFFGDCDKYGKSFGDFSTILIEFLKKYYNIDIIENDISYTENKSVKGSFHYIIPKLYGSCKKLKDMHKKLMEIYNDDFFYNNNGNMQKVIDTTIYSNHWFRLPNQMKENNKGTEHIIKRGKMIDFILGNIRQNSICLDEYNCKEKILNEPNQEENKKKAYCNVQNLDIQHEDELLDFTINDIEIIMNTLSLSRCDNYDDWINTGMCLFNIDNKYLILWINWSKKSKKYNEGDCEKKWKTFKKDKNGFKLGSLLLWAKHDNPEKCDEFLKKKKMNKMILSKYPNEKIVLGEIQKVNNRNFYTHLKNKECLIKGGTHVDMPSSMYIDVIDKFMAIKCRHYECFGKTYPCQHILMNKNEMNVAFNGDITININNCDDELVEFQQINIYDDQKLNDLIYNSLNGKSSQFAEIIYYFFENDYMHAEDDNWYIYKNHKWTNIGKKNSELRYSINPKLKKIYSDIYVFYKENNYSEQQLKILKNTIASFGDTAFKNNIMTELMDIYSVKKNPNKNFNIALDSANYLIGFNNGVYDLNNFEFREGKPDDYISMSVGYDYNEKHSKKYCDLLKFLDEIQPIEEDREYMLTYFSICLIGNLLELFTILSGAGRNGKSKLIELLKYTFGDYFGSVQSQMFTRPRPDANAPDPGLLSLMKKKNSGCIGSRKGEQIKQWIYKICNR